MTSGRGALLDLEVEESEAGAARTAGMVAARSVEGRNMVSNRIGCRAKVLDLLKCL